MNVPIITVLPPLLATASLLMGKTIFATNVYNYKVGLSVYSINALPPSNAKAQLQNLMAKNINRIQQTASRITDTNMISNTLNGNHIIQQIANTAAAKIIGTV
jgi:hypothetical protein